MTDRQIVLRVIRSFCAVLLVIGFALLIMYTGKDSGVEACKRLADVKDAPPVMQKQDYRDFREDFADSRYSDLHEAGTAFMDLAWTVAQMPDEAKYASGGELLYRYIKLVGVCADHDVYVPSLNDITRK